MTERQKNENNVKSSIIRKKAVIFDQKRGKPNGKGSTWTKPLKREDGQKEEYQRPETGASRIKIRLGTTNKRKEEQRVGKTRFFDSGQNQWGGAPRQGNQQPPRKDQGRGELARKHKKGAFTNRRIATSGGGKKLGKKGKGKSMAREKGWKARSEKSRRRIQGGETPLF